MISLPHVQKSPASRIQAGRVEFEFIVQHLKSPLDVLMGNSLESCNILLSKEANPH